MRSTEGLAWRIALIVGLVWSLPAVAAAQSGIAGAVKDSTGAVLPGVSVEATSTALIERIRTVTTDDQGQYKIINLRPGTYTVTFTLSGFTPVKREGIALSANFTATANAEMMVGALQESVTVSSAAPTVDVQNVLTQNVMTRQLQDLLPTPRNYQAVATTTPGVTISRPDVGGSEGYQITNNTVHGSQVGDLSVQIDGVDATTVIAGNTAVYHNDLAYQEVAYQTSGISAEVTSSGIRVSMVPKDGGNTFQGDAFASYAPGRLQSDNFSDELRARGLQATPNIHRIFDYNAAYGGPIRRDKVWFFATGRYWGVDQGVANSFFPDGSQAVNDNLLKNGGVRLTWQVDSRNKIAVSSDYTPKWMGHRNLLAFVDPIATQIQTTPSSFRHIGKWTSPVTNKILLEAGAVYQLYNAQYKYQPSVRPTDISHVDLITGARTVADTTQNNLILKTPRLAFSLNYVTGSHAFKTGFTRAWGTNESISNKNGDLVQRYRNGVPDSVQVSNTPVDAIARINSDVGLYAQDVWTVNRMTLNVGIRFDHFNSSVPEQFAAAGRFVPARSFAVIPDLPNWNDISPRLGVAYDLFGDSRTAVKVSVGKYAQVGSTAFASLYNPMITDADIRTWTDVNGNDIAEDSEIGRSQNNNFGIRQNRFPDPDIRRPYQMEYVVKVERQISSRVSVSGGYFRRGFHRLIHSTNQAVTLSDYTPVTIGSPRNGEPITVHNLAPARLGAVNILDTNSNEDSRTYNGMEVAFSARTGRATFFGGATIGRTHSVACDIQDDPNLLRYCDQSELDIPFEAQYKLSGGYELPLGFQVSGVLQSYPGGSLTMTYLVNRAIVPSLTQSQVSVALIPPGDSYFDRLSQLDLRLAKNVTIAGVRLQGMFDVFNAVNSDVVFNQIQTFGSSLGRPTDVMQGRVFRFGVQAHF